MSIVKSIRDNSGAGKEFETVTTSEVVYDTTPQLGSFNPVTSDGIFKAISGASGEVPAVNPGDAGKVLTAGFDGDTPTVSWEEAQGGSSYTAGDGIKIESGTVSAYHGETLVDTALPLACKTGAENRDAFIGAGTQAWYTALKVDFGNINPFGTPLKISIKDNSSSDVILAMPYTTVDPDLGGKKVKLVFANPDNPSNYIEATAASNVEITQGTGYYGSYNAKVSAPAVLFDGNFPDAFNWHDLTLADIQGADGTTLMYAVACASDGTLITTGSYGPTDNMWTVGFGNGYLPSATTYAIVTMPGNPVGFDVANPVPSYSTSDNGKVLGVVDNSGSASLQWVSAGGTTYVSGSSASVSLSADNTVVTNSVDVTGIVVGSGVHSAIVQWTVASTTTLPTVVDSSNNPLKASMNNPSSLTVGRTVQVSILNGTWVCAEFA